VTFTVPLSVILSLYLLSLEAGHILQHVNDPCCSVNDSFF